MAKSRTVEAPATSDVYFGMVLCSFLAMLVAIGMIVWELTSTYNWESTPTAYSAPSLPKLPSFNPPKADGAAMAPVESKPIAALTPAETPAPVEPKPVLATAPELKPTPPAIPGPIPSTLTPKPAAAAEPAPASNGPVPGFSFPKR